jgi:hypothetical protein
MLQPIILTYLYFSANLYRDIANLTSRLVIEHQGSTPHNTKPAIKHILSKFHLTPILKTYFIQGRLNFALPFPSRSFNWPLIPEVWLNKFSINFLIHNSCYIISSSQQFWISKCTLYVSIHYFLAEINEWPNNSGHLRSPIPSIGIHHTNYPWKKVSFGFQ